MSREDAVLCYVEFGWAWFTTQPLEKQWGDDWNDAPYEHNAGRPYEYRPDIAADADKEPWEIHKVAWDAPLVTPSDNVANCPYSVQDINRGAAAWLRPDGWNPDAPYVVIPAGVTLAEFRDLIQRSGGTVYEPTSEVSR